MGSMKRYLKFLVPVLLIIGLYEDVTNAHGPRNGLYKNAWF